MHSDAQFAGSSSVPAHVEMMGFLGIGDESVDRRGRETIIYVYQFMDKIKSP